MTKTADDTTQISICNLSSTDSLSYKVTGIHPPILGDLPPSSYGTLTVPFKMEYFVTAETTGGNTTRLTPNGLAVWVPQGTSGLNGVVEFAAPTPPPPAE